MEGIRQYIFSVTAAAIICAVLTHISAGAGKSSAIIKLICGLFLAFTVIRPVADIQIEELSLYTQSITDEAEQAIGIGEDFAQMSLGSIIKQETEAYILDKASLLDADITVEIILTDDLQPVPGEVYIHGAVSPSAKSKLQKIISEDIGIAKEYQIWIQ